MNITVAGCFTEEHKYSPKSDIPGEPKSIAYSIEECQSRCAGVAGCYFFTWSDDYDKCHLTGDPSAVLVSTLPKYPKTVAGPKRCPGEK